MNRRPLKTRSAAWAGGLARTLANLGATPNGVSVTGIFFALAGGAALVFAGRYTESTRALLLLAAAAGIQLRLLCNMIDGLIAVECGLKSKTGDLFNEVPDRLEDSAFLIGAGYASLAIHGATLGWLAALLAGGTAYIRVLGGSLGFAQDFCGPMAKQHRMFFLTVTCLAGAGEALLTERRLALFYGLTFIIAGTAVTFVRRLSRIARALHAR
ncbi:MAG: CDP-alcohol phosphatidyltransferase family protein [Nitrospira sp.]|nr:CDP-alcohol phosphatidyltransferase family protein [Nitrospira sp.]